MTLASLFNLFGFKLSTQNTMSPNLIALIIALVQEAITLEPSVMAELQALFTLPNPSPADWEALRQKVLAKSYADYVPASALAASSPVAEKPVVLTATASSNAPVGQPSAPAIVPEPPYLTDGSKNPAFKE
jgi:hypothetical protein